MSEKVEIILKDYYSVDDKRKKMHVWCCPPLDWFHWTTLDVSKWIENLVSQGIEEPGIVGYFKNAVAAWKGHPAYDGELRGQPRVAHHASAEYKTMGLQVYFIFKQYNNGTTFLISDHYLPFDKESCDCEYKEVWISGCDAGVITKE